MARAHRWLFGLRVHSVPQNRFVRVRLYSSKLPQPSEIIIKLHSSCCEIEDFVQTHLCKLCVVL